MEILGKEHVLGSFNITSGAMKVGDPCYSPSTWCLGQIDDVLDGKWKAKTFIADDSITGWGDRNTALFAFNEAYFENNFGFDDIEVDRFVNGAYENQFLLDYNIDDRICVDSGQAGIYDYQNYLNAHDPNKTEEERKDWYFKNGDLTLHGINAGIHEDKFGCVSSSGYGDGVYDVYNFYDKDDITVAVLLLFITNEDEEEE